MKKKIKVNMNDVDNWLLTMLTEHNDCKGCGMKEEKEETVSRNM